MALVTLNAKVTAGQCFYDFALNLNEIVSCHLVPFRPFARSRRRRPQRNDAIRIAMHANFVDEQMPE